MKNTFGKVNLNKIILYLLIVIFLVLALQYAMAFFDLREGKKNRNKNKKRKGRQVHRLQKQLNNARSQVEKLNDENEDLKIQVNSGKGIGSESETFVPYY